MTLELNSAGQQMIRDSLASGMSEEEAAHALLLHLALEQVRNIAGWDASRAASVVARDALLRVYLIEPLPADAKAVIQATGQDGTVLWSKPQPNVHEVGMPDFDAFAKEHHLDPAQLRLVALGEVREFKGWMRHPGFGRPDEYGSQYRGYTVDQEAIIKSQAASWEDGTEKRTRRYQQQAVQNAPVTYLPGAKELPAPKDPTPQFRMPGRDN